MLSTLPVATDLWPICRGGDVNEEPTCSEIQNASDYQTRIEVERDQRAGMVAARGGGSFYQGQTQSGHGAPEPSASLTCL